MARDRHEFSELIRKRYSVRSYLPDDVEPDKLEQVLEAARWAPTAANKQDFRLIVVRTRGREEELKLIYPAAWFVQAPLVICVCAVPAEAWHRVDGKSYQDVDVAIAMDHLILAAADLGLGSCWIARFDPAAARSVLHLPDWLEPVVFTPLGYPDDQPKKGLRRPLAELVRYERWPDEPSPALPSDLRGI